MNATEIRQTFLDFFKSKGHEIVPSAPLVIKNDPTLMFTNAGMNQFKDLFLGNAPVKFSRIADTQKCLRVSGKHNDLEEVGVDTYHHTLFEMLGNWSFGDYFKKEAIAWSWELLTEVYGIDKSQLYVTVFEGSAEDGLAFDQEAYDYWKAFIPEERIIRGSKKDNFWEMGDIGPCGPCTEIHVDIRADRHLPNVPDGKSLVNKSHPQVIEIWNNVFMEFNRKKDGSLEKLPAQHVDTGMGFERLCMVLQHKQSNYDTDVFQPLIQYIAGKSKKAYGEVERYDIAMRVIADHIRAISFSIADGQLPTNNGAGYVIRRILRRAIRYGYQNLELKEPFLFDLSSILVEQMHAVFPELHSQKQLISKVIHEEELAFFKTLEKGLLKTDRIFKDQSVDKVVSGKDAFELYDTYGFPIDLTQLLARENQYDVDMVAFEKCMLEQKDRSRAASSLETGDWIMTDHGSTLSVNNEGNDFVGYTSIAHYPVHIVKYRKVKAKNKEQFQLLLTKTPFYPEGGGQIGDRGLLENSQEKIHITDTKKENGIIIHFTDKLPAHINQPFTAQVNAEDRSLTASNHTATHLLHAALRQVLGTHVEQKGSLVNASGLRFDFSHFAKLTQEELTAIEQFVNRGIRQNLAVHISEMPIEEARQLGAMALFGEKYGDTVRVVAIDKSLSIELCGGTHVAATGSIGYFKILSESAVAAGVRRIEAITSMAAEHYINDQLKLVDSIKEALKQPKDVLKAVMQLTDENAGLRKQQEIAMKEKVQVIKKQLIAEVKNTNGINRIISKVESVNPAGLKDLGFELKNEVDNLVCVLGSEIDGKPSISVIISEHLVKERALNANTIIRELAIDIDGKGGGQAFYATAGGTNLAGLTAALNKAENMMKG